MYLNNTFGLDLPSEYLIREIIFVNSGSNYYVKLPVDVSAALISGNNQGKTSTLSALKLFLLPEVNFKKSAEKFGFASGGRFFSDIDSFQYYFPSTESYIICNAENPAWRKGFCWVLFRSTDLGYQRIAVPHPYGEIEHLFWNDSSSLNDGAGQLQSNIGALEIKKKLLSKEYGGILFTDRTTIGEAIYSRTSTEDDHTRFSLLPMSKRFTSSSVDTVRALLGMAFSLSDASTSTLPMAIGSIIDGMGLSVVKDDGVFIDLDAALDEWQRLKDEDERLSLVESLQPRWQELKTNNALYSNLRTEMRNEFENTTQTLIYEKKAAITKLDQAEIAVLSTEQAFNTIRKAHNQSYDLHTKYSANLTAHINQMSGVEAKLENTDTIRKAYWSIYPDDEKTDDSILYKIANKKNLCNIDISSLCNETEAQHRLQDLIKLSNEISAEIKKTTEIICQIDTGNSFLDHLQPHSRSVLLSLNSVFSRISYIPSSAEKEIIESFTKLFMEQNGLLLIGEEIIHGIVFKPNDPAELKKALENEILSNRRILEDYDKQLSNLNKNIKMTPEQRAIKLADIQDNLAKFCDEESNLKGYSALESLLNEMKIELPAKEELENNEKIKFEKLDTQLTDAKKNFNSAVYARDNAKAPATLIENCWNNLETISSGSQGLLDLHKIQAAQSAGTNNPFDPEAIKKSLKSIENNLRETHEQREKVIRDLKHLLDQRIIESSPEDRHSITTTQNSFNEYLYAFEILYSTLEQSRESHKEQLHAHNNTAATSARMIENIKGIIENFIDGINQELSECQISNLDCVEVTAELHPQYVTAINSMSKVSSSSSAMLSEEFYKQVQDFQNKFYIRKTGKIDLPKIIEKISYRFDRNGQKEAIPQSNGTNCMVNAVLLALLLKRMVPEDLQLSIPVIFDEVGSLDENNLREVLKVMEAHGLTLFAANPDATGVIASVLDIYHDLSCFQATDVEVHGKAEWIYFEKMEERLTDHSRVPLCHDEMSQ